MRLEELEGHYESAESRKAGTRYLLELDGHPVGGKPGVRFSLIASAWALTGRTIPGTDTPMIELIGKRRLEGDYSVENDGLVLHARHMTDTPGEGRGVPGARPIQRAMSEKIAVEINPGPPQFTLHFKLYGSDVLVIRR